MSKVKRQQIRARSEYTRRRQAQETPGMLLSPDGVTLLRWDEVAENVRSIRMKADALEPAVVVAARQAEVSWSEIGLALGVNPQVLRRRYSHDVV